MKNTTSMDILSGVSNNCINEIDTFSGLQHEAAYLQELYTVRKMCSEYILIGTHIYEPVL